MFRGINTDFVSLHEYFLEGDLLLKLMEEHLQEGRLEQESWFACSSLTEGYHGRVQRQRCKLGQVVLDKQVDVFDLKLAVLPIDL